MGHKAAQMPGQQARGGGRHGGTGRRIAPVWVFVDDDRVVIIHADDVGMCRAALPAFADLVEFGLVSSGSVMVPCPWFPQVAAYCRQHPGVDLGVHLTLTSEWDSYRWGPISTRDPSAGLLDAEGYFHQRTIA